MSDCTRKRSRLRSVFLPPAEQPDLSSPACCRTRPCCSHLGGDFTDFHGCHTFRSLSGILVGWGRRRVTKLGSAEFAAGPKLHWAISKPAQLVGNPCSHFPLIPPSLQVLIYRIMIFSVCFLSTHPCQRTHISFTLHTRFVKRFALHLSPRCPFMQGSRRLKDLLNLEVSSGLFMTL